MRPGRIPPGRPDQPARIDGQQTRYQHQVARDDLLRRAREGSDEACIYRRAPDTRSRAGSERVDLDARVGQEETGIRGGHQCRDWTSPGGIAPPHIHERREVLRIAQVNLPLRRMKLKFHGASDIASFRGDA